MAEAERDFTYPFILATGTDEGENQ